MLWSSLAWAGEPQDRSSQTQGVISVVAKLAQMTHRFTGSLLGSFAVAVQAGNVLICVALILFGFDVVLSYFPSGA